MPQMNKPSETSTVRSGWLVKASQRYYTGQPRAFERWTPFPKFAKVYQRFRWAQTMAERLGGQAVPRAATGNDNPKPG